MKFFSNKTLLYGYHVLIDGLFDATPILLSFIVLSFGASEQAVGNILSTAIVVTTFAGLSAVFFSQHLGFFRTLSCITLCGGLGLFAMAFTQNLYYTGIFCIVTMVGHGIFHNIGLSYLTSHVDRSIRGKTLSDFTAIGDIGRIPFVTLAGFAAAISLGTVEGWRIICLLYGVMGIMGGAYALYLYFGTEADKPAVDASCDSTSATAPPPRKKLLPNFAIVRQPKLAMALLSSALDAFASDRLLVFLPFLLIAKGVDPAIIGTFAFGFTFGSLAGKFFAGRMVDRFGTRYVFIISESLMALLILLLLASHDLVWIISISLLLGAVTKGTIPIIQSIVIEPVKEGFGDVITINTFMRSSMNTLTPMLFGFISAQAGIEAAYYVMSGAAALAVVPVICMWIKSAPEKM